MNIRTNSGEELEQYRPAEADVNWQLVIAGRWEEDRYHSGYIWYFVANIGPGIWILDGVERNDNLDAITEEDVKNGRLNDDQIQAMWGMTLEEAQNVEYRCIVAIWDNAPKEAGAKEVAVELYKAVCSNDGKEVTEAHDIGGLLDE